MSEGDIERELQSDGNLLNRAAQGDQEAVNALYQRYARKLTHLSRQNISTEFASRFDAEDIVQAVFDRFFQEVMSGKYRVPGNGEIWHLLTVLALNRIRNSALHHRAMKRDVRATQTIQPDEPCAYDADHSTTILLRLMVNETLGQFSPLQQEIVLDRMRGYEVLEIANRSGRSKRSVERILRTFRTALAKQLR